jgi:hypothetical protein
MIGRLAGLRGTLSSHWLASAIAGAYLVLSLVLGVALLSMPKVPGPATVPAASIPTIVYEDSPTTPSTPLPTTSADPDDSRPGTTTTTAPPTTKSTPTTVAPPGFQQVTGPAGLHTVIPAGWRSARTTGPGAMQATDPADTIRYVKYGGSAAPETGIESTHIQYENVFAGRAFDYKRLALNSAEYGGHDAVEWEFEHREGPNVMHVKSLYWRAEGKEYFVLAAAPATRWQQMQQIYKMMTENATP